MDIRYIFHDCFMVSHQGVHIIFDYWKSGADANLKESAPAFLDVIDADSPVYVIISHSHKDHYNPVVFEWARRFRNIKFIVSRDVWRRCRFIFSRSSIYNKVKPREDSLVVLDNMESYEDANVCVRAYPSTDIGNSYLVETQGERHCRIFHAGDLNAWIWKDESSEQEVAEAISDYRRALKPIRLYLDDNIRNSCDVDIDYAFFPVDSRIGTDYFTGAAIFLQEFNVGHFFPMHFSLGDSEEIERRIKDAISFEQYANKSRGEYIPLVTPGATFVKGEGE